MTDLPDLPDFATQGARPYFDQLSAAPNADTLLASLKEAIDQRVATLQGADPDLTEAMAITLSDPEDLAHSILLANPPTAP